jgi:hypothetical protein
MMRSIVIVIFAGVVVLSLGGLLWLVAEKHAGSKQANPVEYYILHTSMTQTGDQLRNALVGEWRLVGAKSTKTGKFVVLDPNNRYFKTFTLTNWATVNYDTSSNMVNSASGPYSLSGDVCTETIETATGSKRQFLGAHVPFRIRVVGDDYYQMGTSLPPSIEQQWHRIRE